MFETVNGFNEDTVTKKNNIFLTTGPTTSLLSGNIQYLDEIGNLLIIEVDVTKDKTIISKLKDDYVILLNNVESNFHDKQTEKDMQKHKCKQAFGECNKWRILIKTVVGRNITVLSKQNQRISGPNIQRS